MSSAAPRPSPPDFDTYENGTKRRRLNDGQTQASLDASYPSSIATLPLDQFQPNGAPQHLPPMRVPEPPMQRETASPYQQPRQQASYSPFHYSQREQSQYTQPTQQLPGIAQIAPPQYQRPQPMGQQHRPQHPHSMGMGMPRVMQQPMLNGNGYNGMQQPGRFYDQRQIQRPRPLNDDPQYIGSSEGEDSGRDLKPSFASRGPVPSVSEMRRQRESNGHVLPRPRSSGMGMQQAPQTEFQRITQQFGYQPSNRAPPPQQRGRLDSLHQPYQRTADRMQLPVSDLGLDDITISDHRDAIVRMKQILPGMTVRHLYGSFLQRKCNFDDTMDFLTELREEVSQPAKIKTTNRAATGKGTTIRDRYASTHVPLSKEATTTYQEQRPAGRRLVPGKNRVARSVTPIELVIDDDSDSDAQIEDTLDADIEEKVLKYLQTCNLRELMDIAATTEPNAQAVISARPFSSLDEIREVSITSAMETKGKKKRGRTRAIGDKIVDTCLEAWAGYEAIDQLIVTVEGMSEKIGARMKAWGVDVTASHPGELEIVDVNPDSPGASQKDSGIGTPTDPGEEVTTTLDDGDELKVTKRAKQPNGGFQKEQPKNLAEGVVLKDYQIVGVNWLTLLYDMKLSCMLADEMGLGKTCQVIAFLATLLLRDIKGPHLVVVPASTLENWLREFAHFCPALKVEPYYGTQKERGEIRHAVLKDRSWNVLVTTYTLVNGQDKADRQFLKSVGFDVCVYDEGHMLKNCKSARYEALTKIPANYRLILTGTPLQNNLLELASLLAFILPHVFESKREELESIFKYKAKTTDEDESSSALLSAQRIRRARAMMTPFVLRRKKDQVLKHLPGKTHTVEYCDMSAFQKELYEKYFESARQDIADRAAGLKVKKSSNVMMTLRKAAIHPLLFRERFDDTLIRKISKDLMREPIFKQSKENSAEYIYEDMEVMNDFEIHALVQKYPKTTGKYVLDDADCMDSGKIEALVKRLKVWRENGDRVLVFSQFTLVLNILEWVLTQIDMGFLRIDGQTPVDARQGLIDQYHAETDITVFLLSTRAGGMGINLACANKVVIFDSSFNPHDDKQASDRAHRVGQTREVEVIQLVTKGTIEDQILQLANTKLALDASVSSDDSGKGQAEIEKKGEDLVAKMMLDQTIAKTEDDDVKKE